VVCPGAPSAAERPARPCSSSARGSSSGRGSGRRDSRRARARTRGARAETAGSVYIRIHKKIKENGLLHRGPSLIFLSRQAVRTRTKLQRASNKPQSRLQPRRSLRTSKLVMNSMTTASAEHCRSASPTQNRRCLHHGSSRTCSRHRRPRRQLLDCCPWQRVPSRSPMWQLRPLALRPMLWRRR